MADGPDEILRKQGLLGDPQPETPEQTQRREAERLRRLDNIIGGVLQSDVMQQAQLREDRKEHGVLADAGRFIEEQPFLRGFLGTAALDAYHAWITSPIGEAAVELRQLVTPDIGTLRDFDAWSWTASRAC